MTKYIDKRFMHTRNGHYALRLKITETHTMCDKHFLRIKYIFLTHISTAPSFLSTPYVVNEEVEIMMIHMVLLCIHERACIFFYVE